MKEIYYELSYKIYRNQTINRYLEKAKLLDNQNEKSIIHFLNIRNLLSILLFFYTYFMINGNFLFALTFTFLFYLLFTYLVFDYRMKQREKELEHDAIYFFEVLEVTLASGKNLIESLKVTVQNVDSQLSKEFQKTLQEIEYGKSFHDAFSNLRKRIPSDAIQNVILNLMETYTSGGMIIDTLSKQISFIGNKRVMDLKRKMNEIPIKVSVVSVFLLIPLVLLLILSPVILEYLQGL